MDTSAVETDHMTESKTPVETPYPLPLRAAGALCSFAIAGSGQILQGVVRSDGRRLAKGVFFLLALNAMFFLGMFLGDGQNVYLPHQAEQSAEEGKPPQILSWNPPTLFCNTVLVRLQYSGQFWIGLPAWPALWNYYQPDTPILEKYYGSPGSVGTRHLIPEGWKLFFPPDEPVGRIQVFLSEKGITDLHETFERRSKEGPDQVRSYWQDIRSKLRRVHLTKYEERQNMLQLSPYMGKIWDIAWVYTVIAGVLNILVIYDAWAGPIRLRPAPPKPNEEKKPNS
jgi:hypothetical protein